ncbi:MAG: rRNA maturation RNase YbeY [Candidatus Dependentiae bacterium]
MILIKNEQTFPVDIKALEQHTKIALDALDYADFDINIVLVTPEAMQKYNNDFRDRDRVTDILSFPFHLIAAGARIEPETEDDKNLGDIIICPQYVNDDLDRWQMSFDNRMDMLLVHGICHLLGYDHIEDKDYEVMKKKEASLLKMLQ